MESEGYDIKLAENKIEILETVEILLPNCVKKLRDFAKARKAHKFYWKSTKLMETVLDKVFYLKRTH